MSNENDIERQPTPDLHSAQSLQLDALTATQRIRQVEAKVDSIERALCRIFGADDTHAAAGIIKVVR